MGYDTVKLWLPVEKVGNTNLLSHISKKLSSLTECHKETGTYLTGSFGNFLVYANSQGISIKGSLPKWYLGDNIQDTSRGDTQRAIEKLSDEFEMPVEKAKVSQIDFGCAFLMKQKPESYFTQLGQLQYFKRLVQPKSVYYSNSSQVLIFYDKIAESKAKRVILNEIYFNKNLLRYEIRFASKLDKIFNRAEVIVSDLFDENFYMDITDKWVKQYQQITKIRKLQFKNDVMIQPKEFIDQLVLIGIQSIGYENVMQMIDDAKNRGQFEHKKYVSRTKQMIKEIQVLPKLTEPSELVEELDRKIKQVQSNYR
jgi:hypothetical protein